jgi:hypothetical protein
MSAEGAPPKTIKKKRGKKEDKDGDKSTKAEGIRI